MTQPSPDNVVDEVAELLHKRIGLRPDQNLRGRLRRAISEEAARYRDDPRAYADRLLAEPAALQDLLNLVTVQETAFFRHPEQFEALAKEVLPGLSQPVRIWSAACANGQEAYSLAMVLEEQDVDGEVIATDLSTAALQRTAAARYIGRELSGLSAERRARHLAPHGDGWRIDKRVRDRVRTLHHNLLDPLPGDIRFCQVVFCRNVLIYLSPDQTRLFLDRVADVLPPSLTLFVGASETIWQVSDRYTATQLDGCFMYRPRSRARSQTPEHGAPEPLSGNRPDPPRRILSRPTAPQVGTLLSTASGDRPARRLDRPPAVDPEADDSAARLEKAAQDAIAAGDYPAAVVAFRKCAYLRPHDPLAQLHLGLALQATGDERSAQRAFAAARRALREKDSEQAPAAIEGYSAGELLRFLDSRK